MQLREHMAQAMKLVDEMKNDVDAFVVDAEPGFQLLDEPRTRDVHVGEPRPDGSLLGNEPSLLEPEFQRLHLEARTSQEFLLVS